MAHLLFDGCDALELARDFGTPLYVLSEDRIRARIRDIPLQDPRPGDILAVFTTGAYTYSMASNYNRLPRPAMVLVKDGRARLSVRRETYDDLIAREIQG